MNLPDWAEQPDGFEVKSFSDTDIVWWKPDTDEHKYQFHFDQSAVERAMAHEAAVVKAAQAPAYWHRWLPLVAGFCGGTAAGLALHFVR